MNKLTLEQAIVVTGYTGINACTNFRDFHKDVENRMNRSIMTHEFPSLTEEIKALYKDDFIKMCKTD